MKEKKEKEQWVRTTKEHSSFRNTFPIGTEVKIVGVTPIRGYDIQAKDGRRIDEIGWVI